MRCRNCGQEIEPDSVNGYVHSEDGVVGCGKPFNDTEVYAEPEAPNKWHVEDWTGKVLFDGKTFDSFEEGWEFIYAETVNDPDVNDPDFYGEFYVEPNNV